MGNSYLIKKPHEWLQLHVGFQSKLLLQTNDKLNHIENEFRNVTNAHTDIVKPYGGFWTSTYDKSEGSDWIQWNHKWQTSFVPKNNKWVCWLLTPKKNAKIYQINSFDDFTALMKIFKVKGKSCLDFEKISKYYDALNLSKEALEINSNPFYLKGWDVESTVWFNFCFEHVEYLGHIEYKENEKEVV